MKKEFDFFVKNVLKHIDLNRDEINFFCSVVKPFSLRKKEFLLMTGEICRYTYFLTKGCLKTYAIDSNGFEHIIMFSIEDWWAGDMQSFFKDIPAAFNIEALENSKGFRIDKPGLENLFEKVPKFERYFRIITQNSYITQQQRIVQNLSFTAEEKFLYFEKKYPKLLNRVSQKQIASYLGVTPEFLSVLKKRLLKK